MYLVTAFGVGGAREETAPWSTQAGTPEGWQWWTVTVPGTMRPQTDNATAQQLYSFGVSVRKGGNARVLSACDWLGPNGGLFWQPCISIGLDARASC